MYKALFRKTYSQLTTEKQLHITGLGEQPIQEGDVSKLYEIVRARFEQMLPTVTHTNLTANEMEAALGGNIEARAIVNRLWEMGVQPVTRATA